MKNLNFVNQKHFPAKSKNIIKEQVKIKDDIHVVTLFENKWRLFSLKTGKKIAESKNYEIIIKKFKIE